MKATKLIITLCSTLLLFTACGSSINSAENGSKQTEADQRAGSGNGDVSTPPVNNKVIFSASIAKKFPFGATKIVSYNNATNSLEITIPFPLAALIPNASGVLPKHPEISFRTDASDKTITLSVPISKYIDIVRNPTTFPDGRILPPVNGGEPPSLGFPIDFLDRDAFGFASIDSFSIFIESGLNLPVNLEIPIKTSDQRQIGKVHWLMPVNGFNGGVFLSLRLPKALSVLIVNAQ